MGPDFYDSSTLSLVLSWIFCFPFLSCVILVPVAIFSKYDKVPRPYSIWIGICILAFGPLRYLVFMLALLDSYACQSIDAFFSYIYRGGFSLQILLAIVVLSLIGILAPTRLTLWIAGIKKSPSKTRLWLSALSAPILAFVGSLLFSVILPFAGIPFHGLDGDNLIRATNGPVRLLFLANGSQALPPYYSKTPETYTDMVRSHVALMYLSRPNHNRFLKIEYPHLYSEFHEIVMKW